MPLPVGNTLAQSYAIRPLVYPHPVHLTLLPSLIVLVVGIKWLVRQTLVVDHKANPLLHFRNVPRVLHRYPFAPLFVQKFYPAATPVKVFVTGAHAHHALIKLSDRADAARRNGRYSAALPLLATVH